MQGLKKLEFQLALGTRATKVFICSVNDLVTYTYMAGLNPCPPAQKEILLVPNKWTALFSSPDMKKEGKMSLTFQARL